MPDKFSTPLKIEKKKKEKELFREFLGKVRRYYAGEIRIRGWRGSFAEGRGFLAYADFLGLEFVGFAGRVRKNFSAKPRVLSVAEIGAENPIPANADLAFAACPLSGQGGPAMIIKWLAAASGGKKADIIGRPRDGWEFFGGKAEAYWPLWKETFARMAALGKVLEIDLRFFHPKKDFYRKFFSLAARAGLRFSLSLDIYKLFQLSERPLPARGRKDFSRQRKMAYLDAAGKIYDFSALCQRLGVGPGRIINSSLFALEKFLARKNK